MSNSLKNTLYSIAFVVYILVGIISIDAITKWSAGEYYKTLGTKAMDIAQMAALAYTITDQEVAELKAMHFRDALLHPANQRLNSMFENGKFSEDFKYAYIMHGLPDDEVKYHITEENAEYFGAPVGTPLNMLWLVDVIINQAERVEANTIDSYYDDINRYSFMREDDIPAYQARETTYIVTRDEYGNAFTGLVPIYTVENNFVGMLGVDIYFENFEQHILSIRMAYTAVFLIPSLVLTIFYTAAFIKEHRRSATEANTDPLTSLYNRRYLGNRLPKLVREHYMKNSPLSAIMVDIDCFKYYNDFYGHQRGDEVLEQISATILSVLRQRTDVVCRYGGEEILVLLPNTDLPGAVCVAHKIKTAITELAIPHQRSAIGPFVSVSQGIHSQIPASTGKEAEQQYIACADKALYIAKENGRNQYAIYGGKEE